jgi:hypothetical protein
MHGQIIREFDILRVFHFYGRRCGKGRKKHYMHKIAVVKDHKSPKYPKVWWFHHTAEMGEGLTNGYIPYSSGTGDQWAIDQTLDGVEVIDSPATLHDENEKRRIPRQNSLISLIKKLVNLIVHVKFFSQKSPGNPCGVLISSLVLEYKILRDM